jgi:hypothetical protein
MITHDDYPLAVEKHPPPFHPGHKPPSIKWLEVVAKPNGNLDKL